MTVAAMLIAALIFVPLLAASLAHLSWSVGSSWPLRDKQLLARTVVGTRDVTQMPSRLMTFVVAIGILVAGVLALSLADHVSGGIPLTLIGAALGGLFLARGILGYTKGWRAVFPAEPFASYDRKLYSPLILLIGVGFVILVVLRLI